jgi:hypothetical protein
VNWLKRKAMGLLIWYIVKLLEDIDKRSTR